MSAYVDDILIFTSGSRKQHREHVHQVLERLNEAGLQVNINKCKFKVKSMKYLGFIIKAGKALCMDPAKVKAIIEWVAPTTAKGVLGFLSFANFYQHFIRGFSETTTPLTGLMKKDMKFKWTQEANNAFKRLKKAFISAPMLLQFNLERETVIIMDSSGYYTSGIFY